MSYQMQIAALGAFLGAATAHAELTNVFSTTSLSAFAGIERNGLADLGEDIFELIVLDQIGFMSETRQSLATLPLVDASADLSSDASIAISSDQVDFSFDAAANARLDTSGNDTFSTLRVRSANITRFTTDEHVRVTLNANAIIDFDLNLLVEPILAQSTLSIITETPGDEPLFSIENFNGMVDDVVILPPGSYQLRSSVDATFQTFGFPEGLYTIDSEMMFDATIATIPSPGSALALAAPLLLRRRRARA